ncbi:hypothetical protein DFH09DRAFT_1333106 [Mycena vulgaris]|nr:hypothetical protein DFH09DRAFT_1333106 [Mycena vulgaris]
MLPDLAIEFAIGILTDNHLDSLAGILKSTDKSAGTQYLGERVYPARVDDDPEFFLQLGLMPAIKGHARSILLEAPSVNDVEGLNRLRAAVKMLVPVVPSDRITVHHYDKTYPTTVWDAENELVALAMPKVCTVHPEEKCLCWIGQCLQDADGLPGAGDPHEQAILGVLFLHWR